MTHAIVCYAYAQQKHPPMVAKSGENWYDNDYIIIMFMAAHFVQLGKLVGMPDIIAINRKETT